MQIHNRLYDHLYLQHVLLLLQLCLLRCLRESLHWMVLLWDLESLLGLGRLRPVRGFGCDRLREKLFFQNCSY